jgi:hypothetical protein
MRAFEIEKQLEEVMKELNELKYVCIMSETFMNFLM